MPVVVSVLKAVTTIYDLATWPIYTCIQQPGSKLDDHKRPKAKLISKKDGYTYRGTVQVGNMHQELLDNNVGTIDQAFTYAMRKHGPCRCLGTREIIGEVDEKQPNGTVVKKFELGDYQWKSYSEVDQLADQVSFGFQKLGLQPKDRVAIFAETRAEWLTCAIAAYRINLTVVTLYATLGNEAIQHGLNETEVEYVITSHDLLPKFKNILHNTPKVKTMIYMEDALKQTDVSGLKDGVKVISFSEVVQMGKQGATARTAEDRINNNLAPTPDDIAIIMYTSGSTGVPKGVLLSHRNVCAAMGAFSDSLGPMSNNDTYIGFLPLAHVLELMCETLFSLNGVPIGYSSPMTFIDSSPKIKMGAQGDAALLRPTIVTCVPLILDRIYKGINEKVAAGGSTELFNFFYSYKRKWVKRGYSTPLVDKLIFKKVKSVLGGRVRILASGGAPLAAATAEFISTCLCTNLLQGYGLTETAACSNLAVKEDLTFGRVGPPLGCCDVRLVDWEEGNYRVTDKPYPRGEIVVGGANVSIGYFKMPEATEKEFFDEGGKRWFRTGDIGEVHPDGVFKIIDRKKDLVKLQHGEYVSLGKVESELKTCPLVDNICVYGDSSKTYVVALVVPSIVPVKALAQQMNKKDDIETICKDEELADIVLQELKAHALKRRLEKFEVPKAIRLVKETWTPDTDLVTAALKLKRKNVQNFYKKELEVLYS